MNRVSERPGRAKPCPQITPVHRQLLDDIERLRVAGKAIADKIRRIPHVRPDAPEAVYLRFVGRALEDGLFALELVRKYGGTIVLDEVPVPSDRFANVWRCMHRHPPAKVASLDEFRARRAAAG